MMPVLVKYINCFYQCKTKVISDEEWNIQTDFQEAKDISLLPIPTLLKQGWTEGMCAKNVVTMGDHVAYHCVSNGVKVPKKATIKTLKTTKRPGKVKTMQPQNKSKKFVNQEEITEDKIAGTKLILRPQVTDPGSEDFEGNIKDMSSCYGSSDMNGTCLASIQSLGTKTFCVENPGSAFKVCESEILQSCREQQISPSHAQTISVKSRIPLGLTRRRKSIARRKSFLKKGDVGSSAKRRFQSKELEVKASTVGENIQEKKTVVDGEPSTKTKPSFLCLTKKKDAANSTFVKNEFEKKCFKKAFTKDFSSKIKAKSDKTLPENTCKSLKEKTSPSRSHSRKQWNETGVKTFEGMLFSSIFAFSDELRESTESIRVKLQSSSSQHASSSSTLEIAGIFRNLRKVESDLKTIDQVITSLAQKTSKEGVKGYKVIQKGIK